ncbi:hypothetical protein MMC08_003701 [Hypocenomyce scalaris]|nr:hypothetical protein [Hypocenomyce scalaris]
MAPPPKAEPIIIVGAGVFGLSTAIHLADRGYTHVTVFDKQPYEATRYSYDEGCDAASADINKIIRCTYGADTVYQDLSIEAMEYWNGWNAQLAAAVISPPGMPKTDVIYVNNGNLQIEDKPSLPAFERTSIENITAARLGASQIVVNDPADVARAERTGFGFAVDPFHRKQKGKPYVGLLDTLGGFVYADKACRFALQKAKCLGVRFVLGGAAGTFSAFTYSVSDPASVSGIETADGKAHAAALVIMACGGWTPALVPELDNLCETTAGSVAFVPLPKAGPLFERFAPNNFPTWTYKVRDGRSGGLYGFPRDENGVMKMGYRGTKYTNPQKQHDGKERSVPLTRWTKPESITAIPTRALETITGFIDEFLPELARDGIGIERTRLCWYTDSYDNHFVVDRVPQVENLMVATGGSGHAFKFFPNLGKWVVDVVEGVGEDRELLRRWRWRAPAKNEQLINVLMEGKEGDRALGKQAMCKEEDLRPRSDEL